MSSAKRFSSPIGYLLTALFIMVFCLDTGYAKKGDPKDSWPGWRGNDHTARVSDAGIIESGNTYGFRVRWKQEIGSGYSGVSISDGLAITMTAGGTHDYMLAFDAITGEERWRYRIAEAHLGRFGSQNGPISTPLIAEGKVYGLGPRGQFFALELQTGKPVWSHDLVNSFGIKPPLVYGFTTSPIRHKNVIILETSNPDGSAVTGFDLNSGEVLWKAGNDSIAFQSPLLVDIHGKRQLIVPANDYIYGMDPETGKIHWTYQHSEKGTFGDMNLNPVMVGPNRLFVKKLGGKLKTIQINEAEGSFSTEEIWETRNLQRSYVVPVVHDGHFYGINGRFFSCFNAETGEQVWKSRKPGDGFPILVDGHLITITKKGSLHLAKASPGGYEDMASLQLFDGLAWTPPSFANGLVYVRGIGSIAAVEIVPDAATVASRAPMLGMVPKSKFAKFVDKVGKSEKKAELVDAFMAGQKRFPILEGRDMVHFVYRGEADDMAIASEQIGARQDDPMNRVEGTDLFYYSTRTAPDARYTYRYLRNTVEWINDSLNTEVLILRPGRDRSLLSMPGWKAPSHLGEPKGPTGSIDSLSIVSSVRGDTLQMQVYLPAEYKDNPDKRYPVAYMLDGRGVQQGGMMNRTLDNLIGKSVAPVIMVYLYPNFGGWYIEYAGVNRDKYLNMLTRELIPHIDANYRTIASGEGRAAIGGGDAGFMAIYAASKAPGTFSRIGLHSATWGEHEQSIVDAAMAGAEKLPLQFYHDWGKYDYVSHMEGTDVPAANRQLASYLRDKGYKFPSRQVNRGGGWAHWRNQSAEMLETLYPLK